jgi:hypothetical protein
MRFHQAIFFVEGGSFFEAISHFFYAFPCLFTTGHTTPPLARECRNALCVCVLVPSVSLFFKSRNFILQKFKKGNPHTIEVQHALFNTEVINFSLIKKL